MHVITAPSNLGLRPLRPNHEPGTWRAPAALLEAGLLDAIGASPVTSLLRPIYSPEPQEGTRIRNGRTMRDFNLSLAEAVRDVRRTGEFALVIGGDCSILMGALAGAREEGPIALIHIDGHSDFRHPGNYDFNRNLGAAAGMDLALVTGRGEPLGTAWPGIGGSLVADADVIQIGERESRDPDFAWPDVQDTAIDTIDVFEATAIGSEGIAIRIATMLAARPDQGFWIHLDVDVLDEAVMPAVDCPGSPGISPDDLVAILHPLVADERCRGMTVTVFDPDLDPDGKYAAAIVSLMAELPFPALASGSIRPRERWRSPPANEPTAPGQSLQEPSGASPSPEPVPDCPFSTWPVGDAETGKTRLRDGRYRQLGSPAGTCGYRR